MPAMNELQPGAGVFTPFETFDGSEIVIVIETLGTGLQTPSRLGRKVQGKETCRCHEVKRCRSGPCPR
jgi:hypothetical protein